MFPNVYLFNPDYDMAMADFTPYYKSPAEIMRMIADLSVLPWWFAEEGNCVKVENMALVSLLQKQLREVCGGSMEVERRLDELLVETAVEEEQEVRKILAEEMHGAAQLSVMLEIDVHAGSDWYQAK